MKYRKKNLLLVPATSIKDIYYSSPIKNVFIKCDNETPDSLTINEIAALRVSVYSDRCDGIKKVAPVENGCTALKRQKLAGIALNTRKSKNFENYPNCLG